MNGRKANIVEPDKNWPNDSLIIFAIDEETDRIMGRVAIISTPHIENLEIEKDNNNGLLMKQLLEQAENVLKELNRTCALSFIEASNEKAIDYAKRYGYKQLPLTVWLRDLTGD
jgi:hypothetical protein